MRTVTRGQTITAETTIVAETCANCGIVFGLGAHFMQERRNDHKGFYCPNGHSLSYSQKSEAEQLRQQLKSAESRATSWKDQAETSENRRRAQKGVTTRLKNRIANGVCPCCQRSFVDLARHIAGQHPDFTKAGS